MHAIFLNNYVAGRGFGHDTIVRKTLYYRKSGNKNLRKQTWFIGKLRYMKTYLRELCICLPVIWHCPGVSNSLSSWKKHKNIDITSLVPPQEIKEVQLQYVFLYKNKKNDILRCYLGFLVIVGRYFFSFFLKFVLAQFKSVPAEFKYPRDSNGLKILFHTLTTTDARIHFEGMFFMYRGCAQFCLYEPPKTV